MSDRSKFFYWAQLDTRDAANMASEMGDSSSPGIVSHAAATTRLWPGCAEFIRSRSLFFLASANWDGECHCNFRSGEPGFVLVEDDRYLYFPDNRRNGQQPLISDFTENPYIGLLFVDFKTRISVKVSGKVDILDDPESLKRFARHAAYRKAARVIQVELEHVASSFPRIATQPSPGSETGKNP